MKKFAFFLSSWIIMASLIAQNTDQWTPKHIIETEYVRSVDISPNNDAVVWTKRKPVKEKDRFVNDIYLTRLDVVKDSMYRTFQMTNGDDNDYSPTFSRDGELIYFFSSRDKGKKLWSLNLFGGEAQSVHEFENGISNMQWTSDSTFCFTSTDGKSLYEIEQEEAKDNTVVVEDSVHWTPRRIYTFDLENKEIKKITNNNYPVSQYRVSNNGQWLVYSVTRSRHYAADRQPKNKYYLVDMITGEEREILDELQTPSSFQFTEDISGFYFSAVLSSDPEWDGAGINEIYYYDLASHNVQKVNLNWPWGAGGGFRTIQNDIIVSLANGATRKIRAYKRTENGWSMNDIDLGERNDHISILDISVDGSKMVYEYSTMSALPQYFVSDITNASNLTFNSGEILAEVNKKLTKLPITKAEVLEWVGYEGDTVNGLLYYPENYEEGKAYPLILSIHGGPSGVDLDRWSERWSTYPQILAQRGAFVLKPNYHGSSNHGLPFVESIKGNYYTPEIADIMSGIDLLVDRGMVDRDQLGTMGWSNGAIITTMLTVRYPDMFKVACPGAGDVNWTSDYGTCRFGVQFDQSYFGGAPWDDVDGKNYNENYILLSPLFELEKVKTPTIIFHGSEDRAVPRDQGWEYYRALQQAGETQVRFLWFPGQPHGLGKITHQMRKMEEELVWIDRYLFNKPDTINESFKEDSPLDMALQTMQLSQHQGQFGIWSNSMLLPEVSAINDSTAVGVFEVTNAQYASYDEAHDYAPVEANHPAMVGHDRAQAYIQWLNASTGDTYRLPSKDQSKDWHKKAHKLAEKANVLNHWSGYKLTADDAVKLLDKVDLEGNHLIQSVGSMTPSKIGKATVYDIGGNVSEWSEGGNSYGYSAYNYVDPLDSKNEVGPKKVGFRVVKIN